MTKASFQQQEKHKKELEENKEKDKDHQEHTYKVLKILANVLTKPCNPMAKTTNVSNNLKC
jgi:hypothetical protein